MKAAFNSIKKEITKLQKEHDRIMKLFYKTQDSKEYGAWGNGLLYEDADKISNQKYKLQDALEILEKYKNNK